MTTSEGTERPAEPAAETLEAAPLTGGTVASDDPQQLQQEIERTRAQLGQTVQELAARADVKSRARAKAAAAAGRVRAVTQGAGRARDQWVPLAAAAAAVLVVGYLACRQWGRRQSAAVR